MRRRLFTAASVLSLLLCVAAAGLWFRSRWFYDSCSYGRPSGAFCDLSSAYGCASLEVGTTSTPLDGLTHWSTPLEAGMTEPWIGTSVLGFRLAINRQRMTYVIAMVDGQTPPAVPSNAVPAAPSSISRSSTVVVPYWFVCVLMAAFAWISFRLRRQRFAADQCMRCGYSLTGNTSGVCPECGTPVPQSPKAES